MPEMIQERAYAGKRKLAVLDLFSGIGGFSLGLERTGGFETVAFCEIEEFPRKVLRKHWPDVPIYEDVRKLKGTDIGTVDVICGGYPCQPFSTAGRRRGQEDDRHLWPEFNRLVAELRPAWVIGENVSGHISMGLDDVLSDLEGQGYACRTFVIPACAVDAPHRRDRVWIIAHNDNDKRRRQPTGELVSDPWPNRGNDFGWICQMVSDAKINGCIGVGNERTRQQGESARFNGGIFCKWSAEPNVGRVAHGVPGRVDRLKALGNAVVPQIPELIGYAILEADKQHGD